MRLLLEEQVTYIKNEAAHLRVCVFACTCENICFKTWVPFGGYFGKSVPNFHTSMSSIKPVRDAVKNILAENNLCSDEINIFAREKILALYHFGPNFHHLLTRLTLSGIFT